MAVKNGSTISIVHTDYLSTPRIIMNGGSVVWQWRNDNPYGNNLAQGSIEFNLRFAGQYYDSESGLHYNINRMYNPELGRYMQSDPMGLAAGLNTYNYANRNPLDGIDPLGLYVVVLIDESYSLGTVGHVAIDINGQTYGLMPGRTFMTYEGLTNPVISGIVQKYSASEFINHYANEKSEMVSAFQINTSPEQEAALLEKLEEEVKLDNERYQPRTGQAKNCASFTTSLLKDYINSNMEVNKYPWQVRNQMYEMTRNNQASFLGIWTGNSQRINSMEDLHPGFKTIAD